MLPPEGTRFFIEGLRHHFQWPEYTIFTVVLGLSLSIGVFFGCFGKKMQNSEEYLMAGRSMGILPVATSLICTFVSAITLLGHPVEIYLYGQQHTLMTLSFIPVTLVLIYLFVPVFFKLKLTSAYEYFEWRYGRSVRAVCSLFSVFQLISYLPIQALAPSLAMDRVAGFPYKISSAAMFIVCILNSSLGGLKAVIWTDFLQASVMVISVISIAVCGVLHSGGLATIWERSSLTGRTFVGNFDLDPRTRYTVWTSVIGGFFLEMTLFGATQAQIQRYNSVPTFRAAKWCLLYNMFGLIFVNLVCSFLGMVLFAHFWLCDPVSTGAVSPQDQMFPVFVMDALYSYPLLPGLLIAGITCGSLSSMANSLTSLTAVISQDFVRYYNPNLNDEKMAKISKLISFAIGIVGFTLVFIVKSVNQTINLSPLATLCIGSLLGPILGAFTLGLLVPFSNNRGIVLGLLASVTLSTTLGLGNIMAGRDGKLPDMRFPLSTAQCPLQNLTTGEVFTPNISNMTVDQLFPLGIQNAWKERDDPIDLQLWSTSFMWQPAIGCVSMVLFGLFFSLLVIIFDRDSIPKVHKNLLSPPTLRMWEWLLGNDTMDSWVDYSEDETFRGKKIESETSTLNAQRFSFYSSTSSTNDSGCASAENGGSGSSSQEIHKFN